ncbi:uncharacterized protein LOC121415582 isoform X2 [Lytechinus variegatus]|uniref:uncharacterized protein LOC121415582 isoform X2 n=1 Tax=Lytechinus variegatus TaxID=7654 RepID=UPI001BB0F008|nr:uncharacterized protein LOC121415582 isoform X2 [Lytechinus variegatus]
MKTKLLLQMTVSAVFLIIILQLQLTSGSLTPCNDGQSSDPQPPDCFDDCEGLRFFLDRDGLCKMCVQCEPGFGHNKYCGDGENGDAVCVPCPADHYSYNHYDCVACRLCENTVIDQECSFSTDRVCGECLPGFYKDPQNPDLCNQKCEKLSNPGTIPACRVWLENQQVTTVATVTSWMSSLPLYPDHVARGVSMRVVIIIIILLAVVLIGGSVIPVYVCCKHCRNDRKPPSETVLRDVETHSYPDETHGREVHELSDSGSIGGIVIVANNHTGVEAMEVVTVPLVTAGQCQTQEQTLRGGSGENVEDDKDCEKTVLEAFHSANEINYPKGSSVSQRKEQPTRGNSEISLPYVNETDSDRKVVGNLKENGNSSSDFFPFLNSHCRDYGKPPLEMSEGLSVSGTCDHHSSSRRLEQDILNGLEPSDGGSPIFSLESDVAPKNVGGGREEEGNSREAEPDEKQTLQSATLQCTSSNVIGLDEDNLQTVSSDLDGAQRNDMNLGFKENDAKREELECLLSHHDSNYQHGEATQENLIASANAKKLHLTKENKEEDSSKNGSFGSGMSENPRTLRSSEGNESVPLHLGSDRGEDVDSRVREETDEHQRLLPDKQEEKVGGGANSGGDGTGWRGSAEEETRRPTNGEGKDTSLEMNLDFPAQDDSNGKPQSLILNITGPVNNLVIGNQTHNYNNAGPPQ